MTAFSVFFRLVENYRCWLNFKQVTSFIEFFHNGAKTSVDHVTITHVRYVRQTLHFVYYMLELLSAVSYAVMLHLLYSFHVP